MGNKSSTYQQTQTDESIDLPTLLENNSYKPGPHAKYPYFLVQLGENGELWYQDKKVSDAIVEYITNNHVTHIMAQTHGWNTPPDKAVAVPFTQFMAGMQDDIAMPEESDSFRPIWVAFVWPALPFEFFKRDKDALTRAQLVADQEREIQGEDSEIARAIDVAKGKVEAEDDDGDDENFLDNLRNLVKKGRMNDDYDDDDDDDEIISRARGSAGEETENDVVEVDRGLGNTFKNVMRPLEHLVFGRLQARGQRTGRCMAEVLGKLMRASENRVKVCMMANSLGAHVLCGVLHSAHLLPYKVHTTFFVQSAISREYFEETGKFKGISDQVAGPIVCTYSERDLMLKNVFGSFHGKAVGFHGTNRGEHFKMKALNLLRDSPYEFNIEDWSNVDSTEFIDEGNPVAGGHGDFKEDETTSLYWAAITTEVDDSLYEK